jgi:pimeloyl-ACP methyl ester carboxylesterase
MTRLVCLLFATMSILLVSNVYAQPSGSELLEGKETTTAVVLAHGRGEGPDGKVVGPLRKAINKELGFYTLSLQMPVLPTKDFRAYAPTFPEAYSTIQAAIDYLTKEKGVKRIYLMGYSMGARMTSSFLAKQARPAVVGFIGVGVLKGGGEPLDANENVRRIRLPAIDVYADSTPLDLKSAEERQSLISGSYKQVRINGANHRFEGHDARLAQEIIAWLKEQEQKRQIANRPVHLTRGADAPLAGDLSRYAQARVPGKRGSGP